MLDLQAVGCSWAIVENATGVVPSSREEPICVGTLVAQRRCRGVRESVVE